MFNARSAGQQVNMLTEFTKLLPNEVKQVVRQYDIKLKDQIRDLDLDGIFKPMKG